MKILKETKSGTKILLEKNEAFMAFTPKGIQTSMPSVLAPPSKEPSEEDVERLMRWIDDNNPYLNSFMKIMSDLHSAEEYNEPDFKSRQDVLKDN
jgi:hypothetical protein